MKKLNSRDTGREPLRVPLVSLIVAGAAGILQAVPSAFELSRSGIEACEYWRLLTGHLTHFSLYHWAIDAATLIGLGCLYEHLYGHRAWAILLTVSAFAISGVFLSMEPALGSYRGLSGLDCAAFAAAIMAEWSRRRRLSVILGLLFAAKIAYEQITGGFLMPQTGFGDMGLPVLSAHTAGAATGWAAAALLRASAPPRAVHEPG